jgi:hypothetical protein
MRIKTFLAAAAALLIAAAPSLGLAQTYPYNNPTYIPTATLAAQTFTATGAYTFNTNGVASATVRVTGTRVALVAAVQGTNDGTNWTTLQVIPVGGGSVATSITANGFWMVNTAAFTKIRVNITTLTTGNAVVQAAGTLSPNAIYVMNPQAITGPVGVIGTDGTSTLDCAADGSCEADLTRVAGAAIKTGAGTASGSIRVELPTDGTGKVGLIAGSALVGKVGIDQTTPGTTNLVSIGTDGVAGAKPTAATTGGGSMAQIISTASTNATSLKGSAGTLYALTATNTNAAAAYLKLYDKATAPTCNSDTVLFTVPLAQNVPANVDLGAVGAAFTLGIGACITGAQAANDNTNATTGITVAVVYK